MPVTNHRESVQSKSFERGVEPIVIIEEKENVQEQKQKVANDEDVHLNHQTLMPPQTPGRISLSDLVANPEDWLNQLPSATPNEQVVWKHVPGLLNSPSSSVRSTQRGVKRSHSSSPRSSQTHGQKHYKADSDTIDLRSISQSLQRSATRQSPGHDDPAAVLWNIYADKRGGEPALPPLPAFDLFSCTPKDDSKDGFRRTASCGNEWPTSESKRRKLKHHDPHSTTKQIFASKRKEILQTDLARQTRVTLLLDSVQRSLASRQREVDEPSSSSPLPERFQAEETTKDAREELNQPSPSPRKRKEASPLKNVQFSAKSENSSDYGDFDDDDLEGIADALTQGQMPLEAQLLKPPSVPANQHKQREQSKDPPEPQAVVSEVAYVAPTTHNHIPHSSNATTGNKNNDFDEFDDDDDDDVFTNELRELANQIDSQTAIIGQPKVRNVSETKDTVANYDGTFDDDISWDDVGCDDLEAACSTKTIHTDNRAIKRYLVLEVYESKYDSAPGRKQTQKIVSIKDETSKGMFVLLLRQSWFDTPCEKGSYIHLIGNFDNKGQCVVDDSQNMVILHPDHLISSTVIGDAITCLRRAVLQDRVKATSPPQEAQVYGHILHEAFGEAMKLNSWTFETFQVIFERVLPTYLESLYEISVSVADATEYLMGKVSLMKAWAEMFVSTDFVPDAVVRDRKGTFLPVAMNKLLEVEEHVWSPMYGLKGNIDATVQMKIQSPNENKPKILVAPLELKTGKKDNVDAHRAQTALYTLLLSDRYDVDVTSGILYYMESCKTFRVEAVPNEIRQLIIWRNLLASYVHDKLRLPDMIKQKHLCGRCYAQTSCFTYHKLVEGGDGESSDMKEVFDDLVGHLQPQHQEFFKRWDDLLTKEERDSMKFRRELWTMLSAEREQVGRCFSNVVIEPGSAREDVQGPKINRYKYTFTKHHAQTGFSFTESQITTGEPIVISDEKGHFALANGYVTSIRPGRISVAVDRRLQNARRKARGFNPDNNQAFIGIMEVGRETPSTPEEDDFPMLYRIDKDEFSNGMATVRNNLIRIMESDLFRASELRQLIVEQKQPAFKHISTAYSLSGPASQASVNVDQKAAIEKVMAAKDYALVLGMPGTGKTTTIAHIIRALVSQGKSVLLTSYTHTAVDNILLKIKDDNIPVLRLGSTGKVHPDVASFADMSGIPKKTMEELEQSWSRSKVVATTCLGINHGIFNHRIFDYCIVDEASQITLPVCLGPIRFAHTFILVGDHYQLPPLVQNKEAQEGGLDVSLFKLLSDAQPSSVVNLEHQYRMAEDVMLLSNSLIYRGRLKCGTKAVADRTLHIPNMEGALEAHHSKVKSSSSMGCSASDPNCYLRQILTPSRRVIFLDTDTVTTPEPATEILVGSNSRITNPIESTLTAHILTTLIRSGVPPKTIGIITFYRSQLAHLRHNVKSIAGSAAAAEVEMHTADKYQGRDKEVIILSCVRSNPANSVGELLKDWRRVNVAITRARSKLIVIGSKSTLLGSCVPVLQGMVKIMEEKKWIHSLPANISLGHSFEERMQSQTQPPPQPARSNTNSTTKVQPSLVNAEGENRSTAAVEFLATTSRKPLQPAALNTANSTRLNSNPKLPAYKKPTMTRQPAKTVQRNVNMEDLLDRSPIMRDIVNENSGDIAYVQKGGTKSTERARSDFGNLNDFDVLDDDEMIIDF